MARTRKSFDEKNLSKGQRRKLNALRKSVGNSIADRAFGQWMDSHDSADLVPDKNVGQILGALQPLIDKNKLRIPRGGYVVRRGRGRVIVERPEAA